MHCARVCGNIFAPLRTLAFAPRCGRDAVGREKKRDVEDKPKEVVIVWQSYR